jgi:hypothetical protein
MTLPATDDLNATFEGIKTDYYPVEDSSTDRSASAMNTALADVAAMTHTIARAWVTFDPSTLTVTAFDTVWGNAAGLTPAITNPSTGNYVVTFTSTITDALGAAQSIVFRAIHATLSVPTTPSILIPDPTHTSYALVRNWNLAGTLANISAGGFVTVFLY